MKEFKGIWIPYDVLVDNTLNDKEKIIYSMIIYLSKENECVMSNFEAREEELAFIDETDKKFMNQDKANKSKKYKSLNAKTEKIPYSFYELKNDIIKLLNDYIETTDYESYYFYKNSILQV